MHSNLHLSFDTVLDRFLVDFASKMAGFGSHVGLQDALKIELQFWLDFWSNFYRFLLDFDNLKHWFSTNSPSEIAVFEILLYTICCSIFIDFGCHVGFQNPSKILPKSIKNHQKSAYDLNIDLASKFDRFWTYFWSQIRPKMGPKWTKNRSKLHVTCICVLKQTFWAF